VKPHVHFEDEADAEYRVAGRWYEDHRRHLDVAFFDGVRRASRPVQNGVEFDPRATVGWSSGWIGNKTKSGDDEKLGEWLGGRDSNPDNLLQRRRR
jgi:hypothetical protein